MTYCQPALAAGRMGQQHDSKRSSTSGGVQQHSGCRCRALVEWHTPTCTATRTQRFLPCTTCHDLAANVFHNISTPQTQLSPSSQHPLRTAHTLCSVHPPPHTPLTLPAHTRTCSSRPISRASASAVAGCNTTPTSTTHRPPPKLYALRLAGSVVQQSSELSGQQDSKASGHQVAAHAPCLLCRDGAGEGSHRPHVIARRGTPSSCDGERYQVPWERAWQMLSLRCLGQRNQRPRMPSTWFLQRTGHVHAKF